LRRLSDGLSVTFPNKVYTKCRGIILATMTWLRWASMVIPFIEQRRIIEGEQIQSASEKCSTPVDHFFSMASMIDVSVGGSGGNGGTVGLGEDSVKRFLDGWIWTEEGSFPCLASKRFKVSLGLSMGSSSNRSWDFAIAFRAQAKETVCVDSSNCTTRLPSAISWKSLSVGQPIRKGMSGLS
jgi:hypothetical protein